MDRLFPVLRIVAVTLWRDRRSLGSAIANNFFVTVAYFMRMAGLFLIALLACVLMFPLSSDPLQRIPAERFAIWPLTRGDRWLLRLITPWMNPVTWLIAGLIIWGARHRSGAQLWLAVAVLLAIALLVPLVPDARRRAAFRFIPAFPGRFGQLVRKDTRQLLTTLDFYFAAAISISCWVYSTFKAPLPSEATVAFSLLVVLALSTFAQSLFGFDGDAGIVRYQLLPIAGWEVLLSKTCAFLLGVVVLTLPLAPLPALAAALAALAVGHFACIYRRKNQKRWRFTGGIGSVSSIVQVPVLLAAGGMTFRLTAWVILPCVILYTGSVIWFGRAFEHRLREV